MPYRSPDLLTPIAYLGERIVKGGVNGLLGVPTLTLLNVLPYFFHRFVMFYL
jgi:hypothetical protein